METIAQEKEILNTMMKTKENTSFVISEKSKANSFEFGKVGNRFKLYFEDADDLKIQMKALTDSGIYKEE